MIIQGFPTVEQITPTIKKPLSESYWWFSGLNFNRPIIARIGIGTKFYNQKVENFVIIWVGDNCIAKGYTKEDIGEKNFTLIGPIELPKELS